NNCDAGMTLGRPALSESAAAPLATWTPATTTSNAIAKKAIRFIFPASFLRPGWISCPVGEPGCRRAQGRSGAPSAEGGPPEPFGSFPPSQLPAGERSDGTAAIFRRRGPGVFSGFAGLLTAHRALAGDPPPPARGSPPPPPPPPR